MTGGSVRLAPVDAAHPWPIHNAATRAAMKREAEAAALVLDRERMMTTRNHFCQFRKVQPLQTFLALSERTRISHGRLCIEK